MEYKAVALKGGMIKTVTSCGDDKNMALRTAAYYRSVGYSGKCVTEEEFFQMQQKEIEERGKYHV